ncbi:hypothetical protein cyc_01756 [Cyclospora cayetanensis]|uniref:Uncharacterized protein n=1 Tax=Cyclospora cayetanensis TaxID=88456 RepID=A0A1D3CUT1_9EIME|nr:hypothetical protein cyc_01756 [Cyclospora cayetanensis]
MWRCVEAWRKGLAQQKRGSLTRSLVCNAVAALEEDRRLASCAPDSLLSAAKAAAAQGAGEQLCCSTNLAVPWLQLAAAEEAAGEIPESLRGNLWWPAVYLAFRSGDILVSILPSLPAPYEEWTAAVYLEDPCLVVLLQQTSLQAVQRNCEDKEGQRAADAQRRKSQRKACFRRQPRQHQGEGAIVVGYDSEGLERLLRSASPAAAASRRRGGAARQCSADGSAFAADAVAPASRHLASPETLRDTAGRRRRLAFLLELLLSCCPCEESLALSSPVMYLSFLCSLQRPRSKRLRQCLSRRCLLPAVLQQVTQEDFLHYRLLLLLVQEKQQSSQSEAHLLRGLRALRVAMVLLLLCNKFGCFESAALLHLSSDALHEAAEAACGAAALHRGGFVAESLGQGAATGGSLWGDEVWALERQERGSPSEGSVAEFLAQDLAASINSTFGCTDSSSAHVAGRLVFAAEPPAGFASGELDGVRSRLKAVLLSAMDEGLKGTDPLAKLVTLSQLPLFWSVPLLPAVLRDAFGAITKPGVLLEDSDATEGDLPPGLLEALLLHHQPQQQSPPQQQRFSADFSRSKSSSRREVLEYRLEDELWGSYFVLLDADNNCKSKRCSASPWTAFECEQEARRRGDIRSAVAASWLVTDERSTAEGLVDALSSRLFSDFAVEPNHQRLELRAFFLRAFNVLKRSSARVPRRLDVLAARGLFLSLLSSERFFEAMHTFNSMQLQLRLLPDSREEIAAYFAASHDTQLVAGILDALVFLLQQLLAQGYLLENLLPLERLLTFQLVATERLSTHDSPRIEATRSILTQLCLTSAHIEPVVIDVAVLEEQRAPWIQNINPPKSPGCTIPFHRVCLQYELRLAFESVYPLQEIQAMMLDQGISLEARRHNWDHLLHLCRRLSIEISPPKVEECVYQRHEACVEVLNELYNALTARSAEALKAPNPKPSEPSYAAPTASQLLNAEARRTNNGSSGSMNSGYLGAQKIVSFWRREKDLFLLQHHPKKRACSQHPWKAYLGEPMVAAAAHGEKSKAPLRAE